MVRGSGIYTRRPIGGNEANQTQTHVVPELEEFGEKCCVNVLNTDFMAVD